MPGTIYLKKETTLSEVHETMKEILKELKKLNSK